MRDTDVNSNERGAVKKQTSSAPFVTVCLLLALMVSRKCSSKEFRFVSLMTQNNRDLRSGCFQIIYGRLR